MTDILLPTIEGEKDGWPVIHYDFGARRRLHGFHQELDELRERSPFYWSTYGPVGFWMVMRYDEVREAYQRHDVFSSDSIDPLDPDPAYRFIPTLVNPPDHVKYRQVLNSWFSPAAVERITPTARRICVADIDRIVGKGSCDFIEDFALLYPTEVFLGILGLPPEDAELFVPLVDRFFVHFYGEDKAPIADIAGADPGLLRRGARRPARAPAGPLGGLRQLPPERHRVRPPADRAGAARHLLRARPRRSRHDPRPVRLPVAPPGHPRRRPPAHRRRPDARQGRRRGDAAAVHDHHRRRPQDRPGLRLPRRSAEARADGVALGVGRQPRSRGCSRTRRRSSSTATATSTSASPVDRTAAWAPTSPARRWRSPLEEWHRRIPEYRLGEAPVYERGGMLTLFSLPLEWSS